MFGMGEMVPKLEKFVRGTIILKSVPQLPNSFLYRTAATQTISQHKRGNRRPNRHRDEMYRKARSMRNIKIELQDFEFGRRQYRQEVAPEEMRERMKKFGIAPPSSYTEKPFYISSTGTILEQYVPVEGDGKASIISFDGAKQVTDKVKGKGKTMQSVRKIRKYHDDFDPREWVSEAEEIYINAHQALASNDEDLMHRFVTEKCFPEMMFMRKRKTINWNYVKTIEPPRVVHARHAEIMSKNNLFGQLTVRFHSQQTLAIYDRFGRLIHGNENVVKDVLEYCVFEKHLSNLYGCWRLHGKIIPDWKPKSDSHGLLTYREQSVNISGAEEEEISETINKQDDDDDKPTLYDRFGKILSGK